MGCVGMGRNKKVPEIVVKGTGEDDMMNQEYLFVIREESAKFEESRGPSRIQSTSNHN